MNPNPRKKADKRFLKVLILSVLGSLVLMILVNRGIDRYYVFHPQNEPFSEILEPNTRVLKANYLARNCSGFDTVILGSSRAAAIRTQDLDRAFAATSYNFGVATGSLPGMLARLEWLAGLDCMPERVVLPISIDRLHFARRPNDLLRKEHPAIVGKATYQREFLLSYLGVDAFFSNLKQMLERYIRRPEPRFRYDPGTGDVDYLWNREVELGSCPEHQKRTDPVTIARYLDYLERLEALVLEQDSKLLLLWNPIPVMDQLAHLDDAFALMNHFGEQERELFRLPPGDNRLQDSDYYHDPGHFRPELAAAVFSEPANRVSSRRLLKELEALQDQCRG